MKKIDSFIFDLDGTLWSTIDSCVKSLAEVKNKYEEITQDITADKVMSCMGLSFDEIVERYYGYIDKEKAIAYAKEAFEKNPKVESAIASHEKKEVELNLKEDLSSDEAKAIIEEAGYTFGGWHRI